MLLDIIQKALEDLKGQDITILDVKHLTTVTDTMIICTGTSSRHVKSLAENVVVEAKKHHFKPLGVENDPNGEWILIDLGDIMVHVMQQRARDYYGLEKLWEIPEKARHKKPGGHDQETGEE